MSSGREAMVGRSSLCLQRRLSTSSAKPRNIMQHTDSRAHRNCANCEGAVRTGGDVELVYLVSDGRASFERDL